MKKKIEFSKKLCIFSALTLILTLIIALIFSVLNINLEIFTWALPSVGTITSVSFGFYYNKAKMENLSKQRIRTELIRIVLAGRLDEETYNELCDELDQIDGTVQNKMIEMYENSVAEEHEINI